MSPEQLDRVREILERALRLPAGERAASVAKACQDSPDLLREVHSLLAIYDERAAAPSPPHSPISSPTTFSPETVPVPEPDSKLGSPATPTTWGGFLLLEELGRGGFGVVYRAWDGALKRDVALKIIDVTRLRGADVDAVLREGQMMARVRHANIVTVFSAQQIGSEVGLAMEYIKGRTLAALVAEDGPLSADEAALIGIALCDALATVHKLGLVHRDLKASNVMRQHGGHIVLMDFGAGREIGSERDVRGQILGTPVYMPPEMLLGSRGTVQSDIYSLGVLLYNLVTGDYPIAGRTVEQLRLAHVTAERVSLGERRPELPPAFVSAVEKALSPEPHGRPPSAVAFKRALVDAMPHISSRPVRRRRDQHKDATSTPVIVPMPPPPSHPLAGPSFRSPLQNLIVGLVSLFMLLSVAGFLTTVAFNISLGRTGQFADEKLWAYPVWGAHSLAPSVIVILVAVILFNVIATVLRLLQRAIPPFGRAVAGAREAARRWVHTTGFDAPDPLSQLLTAVGAVALVTMVWGFRDLLLALTTPAAEAPVSSLVTLSESFENTHVLYWRLLELIIVVLVAGMVRVRRAARAAGRPAWPLMIGPGAAILVALFLLVTPWRLLFSIDFQEAVFDSRTCLVIGETPDSDLLHCPAVTPPRMFSVQRSDARLRRMPQIGNLFNAYVPLSGSRDH